MSADQDHHYLPQSYQSGWAVDGFVRVFQWRHKKLDVRRKSTAATGSRPGMYYIPMAPPEKRNFMEDDFWRQIDQWGADNLALLRSTDPAAVEKLDKERLATFIMSFEFRNPRRIAEFQAQARSDVLGGCLSQDYSRYRRAHEPDTFEEYKLALELPGLTEMCAEMIRTAVMMPSIREEILNMEWQVVELANSAPLVTSDVPLIRHKGLRDDDGILILPLSPREVFVAYNLGKIDMKAWIDASIRDRTFVEGMYRYVIGQKIDYVYADDDRQRDFIAAHWHGKGAKA